MLYYVFGLAALCMVVERMRPGWKLPAVRTWPYRVVVVNAFQLGVVLLAGVSWERWLSGWAVFDLAARMPAWAGGCLTSRGYLRLLLVAPLASPCGCAVAAVSSDPSQSAAD